MEFWFNRYTSPNRLGWVKTDFLGMVALCEVNGRIALVIKSSADVGSAILAVFAKGDREKALDALDRLLESVYAQCDFSNDKTWLDDSEKFERRVKQILIRIGGDFSADNDA